MKGIMPKRKRKSRRIKQVEIKNLFDPLTQENATKPIYVYPPTGQAYSALVLSSYLASNKIFQEPVTRMPFTDEQLQMIDRLAKTGLLKEKDTALALGHIHPITGNATEKHPQVEHTNLVLAMERECDESFHRILDYYGGTTTTTTSFFSSIIIPLPVLKNIYFLMDDLKSFLVLDKEQCKMYVSRLQVQWKDWKRKNQDSSLLSIHKMMEKMDLLLGHIVTNPEELVRFLPQIFFPFSANGVVIGDDENSSSSDDDFRNLP